MASNLGAIGFDGDDDEVRRWVAACAEASVPIGRRGKWSTHRWEDDSGARVTFQVRSDEIETFLPSFNGRWPTVVVGLAALDAELHDASIVDAEDQVLTRLTLELEERAHIPRQLGRARVRLVALGNAVAGYSDAEAFAASDDSLIGDPTELSDPPPVVVELGLKWPPRYGSESFFSTGQFAAAGEATAHAIVNGIVEDVITARNSMTGQAFQVLAISSIGMKLDVCIAGAEAIDVTPGMVASAHAFMVGSVEPDFVPADIGWRRFIPFRKS